MHKPGCLLFMLASIASLNGADAFDLILRNGTIYNGSGQPPVLGDVAVKGDKIAAVGNLGEASATKEMNVRGLAIAPGFINVLSWANESLIEDGRSQSDIRQGVTLEILGEGESMGPLNSTMKQEMREAQGDIKYEVTWTTLGEYLDHLVQRGISCNVASFLGATSVRIHELGHENRVPTRAELRRMKQLVRGAMEEGALGIASSLIYAPAFYARTDELIELCKVASEYSGLYISHLRSEGNTFLESLDELLQISREARIPAQVYHLKAAGQANWHKMDAAIRKIEAARASGLRITADMYTYTAGATGLDAAMPPWVQEGGYQKWAERLQEPDIRRRVLKEMVTPTDEWESLYLMAGSADKVLLVGFKNEKLKQFTGKSLAQVAKLRGQSAEDAAIDLVIEDGSRVNTVYFLMSEDNVRKQIQLPWVSFNSDSASLATEGVFLKSNPHPRAYGNFARLLGKYVRDEKLIPLEEAIRRLTSFPAETFKLDRRGALQPGYYADIVVFDPKTIQDHATYEQPHQYATGVAHVFVNGVQVLEDGEHTGAKPGQVVRGPGWKGSK